MYEEDGITYELLQEKDLQGTIDCLIEIFITDEQLTKELGFTTEEFYPLAEIVCVKAVEDKLSLIPKDVKTGEVIGFTIAQDLFGNEGLLHSINEKVVKFKPAIDLVEKLETEYLKNKPKVEKGQILYVFMSGVRPNYRGGKVARIGFEKNVEAAKRKNYQYAMTECTSRTSQITAKRLGFKEIVSIDYKDFLYEGKPVFQGLAETHKKCILMEKVL